MTALVAVAAERTATRISSATAAQHRTPIIAALRAYQSVGTVPFSTPGHKRGMGLDRDLRELLGSQFSATDIWMNTAEFDHTLRRAEDLAARTWGAERSFFLVNGSSSGNQAFLMATVAPGDEVIVGRDLHQSLLAGLILTGARPVYVAPRLHLSLQMSVGVTAEDVVDVMNVHPAAKLLILTSPTYWGVASELRKIVAVAHARGVAVYIDEAWGPHFGFHPELPPSAMNCGADGAVTSPHKLLTGLSQAALLNVRGPRIDPARVASALKMIQTTSPLMPLLASLDACRRQMALDGPGLLDRTLELADSARETLSHLPGVDVLDASRLGMAPDRYDRTRLVIDVKGLGMTGYAAEQILREQFGLAPEMSDTAGIICLVTVGDTPETIDRLVRAIAALGRRSTPARVSTCPRVAGEAIAAGEQKLTPREAYFARTRVVPLREAVGKVAAEAIIPYPPGIPVLTPGEVISEQKVDCLWEGIHEGMHVRGAADLTLQTLRVVNAP